MTQVVAFWFHLFAKTGGIRQTQLGCNKHDFLVPILVDNASLYLA